MIKNAIILHGIDDTRQDFLDSKTSPSNSHWLPWIKNQLIKNGISAKTPEMPNPYMPDMNYDDWADFFSSFEIDSKTLLIGHSAGAGFLLKYLSFHKNIKFGRLILVAPWIDIDREHPTFFDNFNLDSDLLERCEKIDIFYSKDDMDIINKSINRIKSEINGVNYHEFQDKGHFCESDIGLTFPELLKVII